MGKTRVGEMFVALGCRLIDSDQITHELFEAGEEVHEAVVAEFGPGILDERGGSRPVEAGSHRFQ